MKITEEETVLPKRLNAQQRQAIHHGEGPLLVVAGAGTGKTMVITHRIAHLINAKRAKPEEILALTFTEKAAAEMSERVDLLVPYGFMDVAISTFHAFGDRVLRDHALELGLVPDFRVLSRSEQIVFLREHLFALPLSYYRPLGDPTRHLQALASVISRAKDEDVSPEEYLAYAQSLKEAARAHPEDEGLQERSRQQMEIAETYKRYQELMASAGYIDFGDQISLVLKLFREHPLILRKYQERYRYLLIDEFQDTNYAQFQLVKLMAALHQNITVVGDDDQSIYKFRGAAISNILSFLDVYPQAKQIVLTQNYRSPQALLDVAYRLIRHNDPDRLEVRNAVDKRLSAQPGRRGEVRHLHFDTLSSEADGVAQTIEELKKREGLRYQDFAILVRANADADPFLRSLNMKGIPWRFSGNQGLYAREEIRLLIAFLRCLADFQDSVSLFSLATSEIYQMDALDLVPCMNLASRRHLSLHHVFFHLEDFPELEGISEEGRATIEKIRSDLQKFSRMAHQRRTGEVLYEFLTATGYLKRLASANDPGEEEKVRNLARFFNLLHEVSGLLVKDRVFDFLQHLQMLMEAGDDPAVAEADPDLDAVQVLTVHKAKGLEFPVVFLVGLVSDRFPSRQRKEPIELPPELAKEILPAGDFHLQEERRLFYVGMTRAQRRLYLTSAADYGGGRPKKVSRFLLEAMDRPQADFSALKATPMEVIQRHAPRAREASKEGGTIPPGKTLTLSHRQVDDYLTCPLKYKYIHVLGVPILTHHTVTYGYALHQAVCEYLRGKMAGRPPEMERLLAVFEGSWRSEGFLSREHEEQRLEAGRRALIQFYEREAKDPSLPTHVEREFSFSLDDDRIIGRWDRLDLRDGQGRIIDYKSSEVRDQKEADRKTRESLQLKIYALAYREMFGQLPETVELHFLGSPWVGALRVQEKHLEEARKAIQEASLGIRLRRFQADPEYIACGYCPYEAICPHMGTDPRPREGKGGAPC
ncbi:MAG: ATP-dependent DNA helicase [candidate division NC10 bacterium]|nr:ATP-dependent DNA helicase [candidate division NC10 bacterium]